MPRNVWFLALCLSLALCYPLASEASQGDARDSEPRRLVESPTAGVLPRGSFDVDLRMFPNGGMLGQAGVGLMDRLMVGFSFGGEGIIGQGDVDWNPRVEFGFRYRLVEESRRFPALAVGFESQGYGPYYAGKKLDRYATKSKGFYAVLSRNYNLLGAFGLHGGVNYSLERKDDDKTLSGFVGLDKQITPEISVLADYDLALNDGSDDNPFSGKGYLHAGVRWAFEGDVGVELDFKDLLTNQIGNEDPPRELRILYVEHF